MMTAESSLGRIQFSLLAAIVMVTLCGAIAGLWSWHHEREVQWEDSLDSITQCGGKFYPDKRPFHTEITVDLSRAHVGDEEVAALVGAASDIVSLDLSHTEITNACVSDIVKLAKLKHLNLEATQLSGGSKNRLTRALPECAIVE